MTAGLERRIPFTYPALTLLIGVLFMGNGEPPSLAQMAGAGRVLAGVLLVSRR